MDKPGLVPYTGGSIGRLSFLGKGAQEVPLPSPRDLPARGKGLRRDPCDAPAPA